MGVVIIGCGITAETVLAMVERDAVWDVIGFATDRAHLSEPQWHGRPVCALDELETWFPPQLHAAFVAIGNQQCNRIRVDHIQDLYARGYQLASYRSPWTLCTPEVAIGGNVLLADGAVLQPHTQVESGVFVWHSAQIGHHSLIRAGSWLEPGALVGCQTDIGERCLVAAGACVGAGIRIGDECLLGPQSLVTRDLPTGSVLMSADTTIHPQAIDEHLSRQDS